MADARRGRFDIVLVWASDRIARSVKHFLDVLDEMSRLGLGTRTREEPGRILSLIHILKQDDSDVKAVDVCRKKVRG